MLIQKLKKRTLTVVLTLALILPLSGFAFTEAPAEVNPHQYVEITPTSGNFYQGDVEVINNIIRNNGLNWVIDDVENWPADPPGVWGRYNLNWRDGRLYSLILNDMNLVGHLDVTGLDGLRELRVANNHLDSINVSGLSNLRTLIAVHNNLTSVDVSGLINLDDLWVSDITLFCVASGTLEEIIFPEGNRLFFERSESERVREWMWIRKIYNLDTSSSSFALTFDINSFPYEFMYWEVTGIDLPDNDWSRINFHMPNNDVTIRAVYRKPPEYTLGDINGDGRVNIIDLQLLLRHISGSSVLTDARQLQAADINRDGDVDIRDLRLLLQFISGRITSFD